MSIFSSLWTAVGVARTSERAITAARDVLAAHGTAAQAIDAFAAAADSPLANTVAADLHLAADRTLYGVHGALRVTTTALLWLDEHQATVEHVADVVSKAAAALPRLTRRATHYAGVAGAALVKAQLRLEALGAGGKG